MDLNNAALLPIHAVLAQILRDLEQVDRLVIQAPPGAGKTTVVPAALLEHAEILGTGRILLIQPRRLAVYGAARALASRFGQGVGGVVGYRTRYDSKVGAETRIEVVTEGIFLRRIQEDPELNGVSVVIFDEFHERSVNIDLGLAFALDAQRGLRAEDDPLRVLVMSATLDGSALSAWLGCPLVVTQGRCYPVVTRYAPLPAGGWFEKHVASVIFRLLQEESGSVLVFLPGYREIQRVKNCLAEFDVTDDVSVCPLHASLPPSAQEQAIAAPAEGMRKVVLATNIAETSVTIEGIRVVVDSGWVRTAAYDERRGMTALHTERVSAASAEQRRGRAGRVTPGVCVRLWNESDTLKPFADPEIAHADLLPVRLELALWGVQNPSELMLLDTPPQNALQRAEMALVVLDVLDQRGVATALARKLSLLGLHPRLAHLVFTQREGKAAHAAMLVAMILSEGDPLTGRSGGVFQADLTERLVLWDFSSKGSVRRDAAEIVSTQKPRDKALQGMLTQAGVWQRVQQGVRQLARRLRVTEHDLAMLSSQECLEALGLALIRTFSERVAMVRLGQPRRYLLANGRGVQLLQGDHLAGRSLLVVLDCDGAGTEPVIRLALEVSQAMVEAALPTLVSWQTLARWNATRKAVEVEQQLQLGALVLQRRAQAKPWPHAARECLLQAIRDDFSGVLPLREASVQWLARVRWLHNQAPNDWPDLGEGALLATLEVWLEPWLEGVYSAAELERVDLLSALKSNLTWDDQQRLERFAPAVWRLPVGIEQSLDYLADNGPVLSARVQAFYGLDRHPILPNGHALLLELLSPAQRPVQITRDLVGFWAGSYRELAKEMRGRYPKHFWPEDPAHAQPTLRTRAKM
ncbi:ATP-dependent helicase HrpB [gamma proteobacterium HdN1]|nr:ATP-dependent helicase HrpB [gamma proteobacterium HdN1]